MRRAGLPSFVSVLAVLIAVLAGALAFRLATASDQRKRAISVPPAKARSPSQSTPESGSAPPPCTYGRSRPRLSAYEDWQLTLVDTHFGLPSTYRPPDLVSVRKAGFSRDLKVRSFLIGDLAALRNAAAVAGNPVDVIAAYRSYAQQASLYATREQALGYAGAIRETARPGHSEHQLGTTVDFKTPGQADVTRAWASTPAGRWVAANAYRFGFIQSYPRGKTEVTCYAFEPWHFRYFGRNLAARIQASGLTAREYLWRLEERGPTASPDSSPSPTG